MKAVPKVGLDGLYIEDELVDDTFTGVVPFYAVPPKTEPVELDGEFSEKKPQPVGYIVGVPVSPGLFWPRFDLAAWEAYQDEVTATEDEYQRVYSEWVALPEEERGEPPVYTVLEQPNMWGEGLTLEEVDELTSLQKHKSQASSNISERKTTG
ncbi:hypothetical protein [Paenibacillus woosongensis]|uniref:Uncharacterized protein n=1 Tax=Paenibacillus woosongensis TaxID=307580 RepID=A0A7X2Z093_9BACL|nr:hypothetical protein [Paenibacillus woosongensis]MUG45234.1 hypothetical protein [Paenibacillus woosongensis]